MGDVLPAPGRAAAGLIGSAFIALWNDVTPGREREYNEWHTQEHVPQRVGIPGILSGRRYVRTEPGAAAPRYFTLYDLVGPEVLDSGSYTDVVRHPTAWSASMRPSLQRFRRLPCRRVLSLGGGIGGAIATLRLPGTEPGAVSQLLAAWMQQDGVTAIHLGEPCRAGQPFPLGESGGEDGGSLLLVEGTDAPQLLAAARALAPPTCVAAGYALAFLASAPGGQNR